MAIEEDAKLPEFLVQRKRSAFYATSLYSCGSIGRTPEVVKTSAFSVFSILFATLVAAQAPRPGDEARRKGEKHHVRRKRQQLHVELTEPHVLANWTDCARDLVDDIKEHVQTEYPAEMSPVNVCKLNRRQ